MKKVTSFILGSLKCQPSSRAWRRGGIYGSCTDLSPSSQNQHLKQFITLSWENCYLTIRPGYTSNITCAESNTYLSRFELKNAGLIGA